MIILVEGHAGCQAEGLKDNYRGGWSERRSEVSESAFAREKNARLEGGRRLAVALSASQKRAHYLHRDITGGVG